MKIVQINSFSNGSTGTIMINIHKQLLKEGYESYIIWGRGRKSINKGEIYLNDKFGVYYHALYSRLTGKTGFASKKSTKRLINILKKIKPDIIHLHNIHGYYINIELLFNYIKENNIKVVWTLHDCWAFTGQCPHFTLANCNKWEKQCCNCAMIKEYPKTIRDNSKWNYQMKKKLFSGVDMTIVTPSKWLANLVKKSFLGSYSIKVINNGVDMNIFKPTKSNFRKKYNLLNKKIILGVASIWDTRKGIRDYIELSKILDDNYRIVLIGVTRHQLLKLPSNIVGILRTENQTELAGIYTTADILFNPTYEDNYPTVNIEALACGTPVLSYDTGGSTEFVSLIDNTDIQYVVEKRLIRQDIYLLKKYIDNAINTKIKITNKALLDKNTMINEYIKLYNQIIMR